MRVSAYKMKLPTVQNHLRPVGLLCAALAVGTGIIYFQAGVAPYQYSLINLLALLAGAVLLLANPNRWARSIADGFVFITGLLLIAVSLWGSTMQGVSRWLVVGGFYFEPALVVLPFSVMLFARSQHIFSMVGIIMMAAATAMQPDCSMAGALCLGLTALLSVKRNIWIITALGTSIGALGITLIRPDHVAPAPFVERVFISAFNLHPALGIAIVIGAALLLAPAIIGIRSLNNHKETYRAFAGVWLALVLSAALGNYPTPLVGYGCSAILGYCLCVKCLPKRECPKASGRNLP